MNIVHHPEPECQVRWNDFGTKGHHERTVEPRRRRIKEADGNEVATGNTGGVQTEQGKAAAGRIDGGMVGNGLGAPTDPLKYPRHKMPRQLEAAVRRLTK